MARLTFSSPAPAGPDGASFRGERKTEFEQLTRTLDPEQVLAELRTDISNGNWSFDAVLQRIAEAAQIVTCANGVAVALRREGVVICQARSGDIAPDLGARLDADSGISGECLRTGWALRCDDTNNDTRVNAEVCRRLGLRSLAVVPLGKKPVVAGILEAFSALPYAFRDTQMELLQELAELVVAAQRRSAEPTIPVVSEQTADATVPGFWLETSRNLQSQAIEVASRQVKRLVALVPQSWSARKLIAAGVAGVAVLAVLVWVVFRGKPSDPHLSTTKPETVISAVAPPAAEALAAPVRKPKPAPAVPARNPGSSASSSVVLASKTEEAPADEDVFVRNLGHEPASTPNTRENAAASITTRPTENPDSSSDSAPVLAAVPATSGSAIGGVLSAPTNLPQARLPVSEGLTVGTLLRKVEPIYPAQARALRLEGLVLLQATVAEDGTVHDVQVIKGHPVLAHAAQEAVARWHYRPFLLNGKPVPMRTEIKVEFKLP